MGVRHIAAISDESIQEVVEKCLGKENEKIANELTEKLIGI
jgi:hypothetical protein